MKRQVDARRLAQLMVGIGRRMDKRVQALITDMNQPLGYAIGNALEIMEVVADAPKRGPEGSYAAFAGTGRPDDLPGEGHPTLDEARELAQTKLLDGSGYRKFKEVITGAGRQSAGAG